jgi:cob(I)alamin adenosyltransferase
MPPNRRDEPVVLSRIYTKTGDDGRTSLADGSRAAKTDRRLAAYADVEEANCAIGVVISLGQPGAELTALLSRVQNELFDVGADLANPRRWSRPATGTTRACRYCAASCCPGGHRPGRCCTRRGP